MNKDKAPTSATSDGECKVCSIHTEIHDVLREGYSRLEHNYRLTIDGLIDVLKPKHPCMILKHSVCTQTNAELDLILEKQADVEKCNVPCQNGSGELSPNAHGQSLTYVSDEGDASMEEDVKDDMLPHDSESETYDQMLPMNDLEANSIVSKAVAVFYPDTKETTQIHSLRLMVKKKLMDILTRKKRNDILSHIKLTAMGCIRWQCTRCSRCFTSPRALS